MTAQSNLHNHISEECVINLFFCKCFPQETVKFIFEESPGDPIQTWDFLK